MGNNNLKTIVYSIAGILAIVSGVICLSNNSYGVGIVSILCGGVVFWELLYKSKSNQQYRQGRVPSASSQVLNGSVSDIIQEHWNKHLQNIQGGVKTEFSSISSPYSIQLLSVNSDSQLLLDILFKEDDLLSKFRQHQYYSLFTERDPYIFSLEFGGFTDSSIKITSAILCDIFGEDVENTSASIEW